MARVAAILGLAVVLRAAHVLALRATPWFEHLVVDPEYYDAWARQIEVSDNQDQYLLARDSWVLRLPLLGFGALVPFALLGAIAGRARGDVRLLCGLVLVYCASVVAFFMFSRYRIQVVPALLPLAALGAIELGRRLRARDWPRVATASAVLVAAGIFAFHTIGIFSARNPLVVAMRLQHLADIHLIAGQPDRAIAALQEAVRGCPTACPQPLDALFDAYARSGRVAEGEAYFRRLAREHPEQAAAARYADRLRETAAGPRAP